MTMNLLDSSLSAVADPTRRAILGHLRGGSATVSALVEQFDLTQPTISSHLKILERAGLITRQQIGQTRPCSLNPAGLKAISDWLGEYEMFWEGAVDRFAEFVSDKESDK